MNRELDWIPRGGLVVLKAILNPGVEDRKLAFEKEGAEEVINNETITDVVDADKNFYIEDYKYFIIDKGESVQNDLLFGDEVLFNFANLREIQGVSDRSKRETYFTLGDSVITMRKPGPIIL